MRCLARNPEKVVAARSTTTVVQGDCLDEASVYRAFAGVDTAFYLVHSMAAGSGFEGLDQRAALNFGLAAARAGVRRIIYLGGLGADEASLSRHLRSRVETGSTLRAAGVPVVEFRASIVIGAGSLPFEMIRALVERLPVMICPRWVDTLTQPIAVDDVIAYLVAALDLRENGHSVFEIGGPEVVSYGDLMRCYARLRDLRRVLLPVPVITPHLSGLWLGLVTPAQARIGRALVEGLRNATVVRSDTARRTFGITPLPLFEALARAVSEDRSNLKTDRRIGHRRCSTGGRIRPHPSYWRRRRLVFRQSPVEIARVARPMLRRRRDDWQTPRLRAVRGWRHHRRMDGRGIPARQAAAPRGGHEAAGPGVARVRSYAARFRAAIAHFSNCDVRSARRPGSRLLGRRTTRFTRSCFAACCKAWRGGRSAASELDSRLWHSCCASSRWYPKRATRSRMRRFGQCHQSTSTGMPVTGSRSRGFRIGFSAGASAT